MKNVTEKMINKRIEYLNQLATNPIHNQLYKKDEHGNLLRDEQNRLIQNPGIYFLQNNGYGYQLEYSFDVGSQTISEGRLTKNQMLDLVNSIINFLIYNSSLQLKTNIATLGK